MSEITETHAASGPAAVSAAGTSAGPGAAGWAELPSAEQRRAALSSGTVPGCRTARGSAVLQDAAYQSVFRWYRQ